MRDDCSMDYLKIHIHNRIPLVLFHFQEEVVSRDASRITNDRRNRIVNGADFWNQGLNWATDWYINR